MRTVAVSELRRKLSQYLMAVQAGEELLVTDRGEPVARIVPISGAQAEDAHRQRLIRAGILHPRPRGLSEEFWARPKPVDPEGAVLEALLREREETR
jgi:prevent-host-death family protein